jgi:hypothetical protein
MNVERPLTHTAAVSFRNLGLCWFLYGILRLAVAAWLVFFSATATLMFGALLNRVADPFTMMNAFHLLYAAFVVFSAVCGILAALAGLALLSGAASARTLTVIAAVLSLSGIPFGTTLGIYSLIVLLSSRVRLTDISAPEASAPHLKRQTLSV